MKKIMQFIHGMTMGGAETLVKDYLINFDNSKYELVLLVLERHDSTYEKIIENKNIKILYVEDYLSKNKGILFKIYNHMKRYSIVKKLINKEDPDIIHYHLPLDSYIKYAKPKKTTRIFSTIHNEPKKIYDSSFRSMIEYKAAKWLVKNYKLRFITLHEDMRIEINKMFGVNNSIVLNNGIDFKKFNNSKSKEQIRSELKIPKNSLVVGHIGRFTYQKNHEFLVDVFYELSKIYDNSFLLMVGKGNERKNIEAKLKELNLYNKYLILEDRSDIPDLMMAMDIFLFPSHYEGLSVVLIEAQKMKLPCFISDSISVYTDISNLINRLSLDKTAHEWALSIEKYKQPNKIVLNDKDWDIKEVVAKLVNIYENKI